MELKGKVLRKIFAVSMAVAMAAGTGISPSTGTFIGTNTVVSAAETYGSFEYTISKGNTVTITKYTGKDTQVTIPSTINGKSVTVIGNNAFDGYKNLKSITIPDSITEIGYRTFYGCKNLKSITIPDSIKKIGGFAFAWCEGLTSITIPHSVTSIERYAFYGCTGLTSITIPNSVTSIQYSLFEECISLKSITLPETVQSIGNYAFRDCKALTNITLPNSVTSIGMGAFWYCSSLKSITIPESVTSIGQYAFYGCKGFTVYGNSGSYVQSYTDKYGGSFVAFINHSVVSADNAASNKTITVKADAEGGTGNYTYAVLYKKTDDKKWIVKQNYQANANVSVKAETAGTYDICVKAKDQNGLIEKAYFTVEVQTALSNTSTLSATEIALGDTVTATAQATGGYGNCTYAVFYKKTDDTKWIVKQNYQANANVSIKPETAGTYDICVKAKDQKGDIEKVYFTVEVKKLTNTSALSATEINLGDTVTVTAQATDGTSPYTYAVYTKKSTVSKWTENQVYSANASLNFKPTAKGTYDICVKVKDTSGKIEKKYLTLTVQ